MPVDIVVEKLQQKNPRLAQRACGKGRKASQLKGFVVSVAVATSVGCKARGKWLSIVLCSKVMLDEI